MFTIMARRVYGTMVTSSDYWQQACSDLSARDATMARLIERFEGDRLDGSGHAFQTLVNAIVGQQISVAAAESIWKRIRDLEPDLTPRGIIALDVDQLRSAGLSGRKTEYIQGIARAFADGTVDPARWYAMTDDEVRTQLTGLRGVGPWTADMMLIFYLHRPDVLPLGDIGLVNGTTRLYGWDSTLQLRHRVPILREYAELWRPWRTVATWYVWRDLDAEPVLY